MDMTQVSEPAHICTNCQTTKSHYWRGMKKGTPLCNPCYIKQRKAKLRQSKRRVYDITGHL